MKKTWVLLLAVTVMLCCLSTAASADAVYTPGTYSASAYGFAGNVTATVEVTEDSIASVSFEGANETTSVGGVAMTRLAEEILAAQSVEVDAITGATPLGLVKEGGAGSMDYASMLFANIGGSAGEVCALALLAGFVYLLCRRVIKPWITLSIFATVALTSLIFWGINPERFTDPLFNLLSGGLILGACFMATDYVTSPMSNWGGVIFGIGIGFITMMIRYFGSYPEGVSFAILIMNAVVPLLNRWFRQPKFGRK